jgi:hypothetical protein
VEEDLMEAVVESENMSTAYRRVVGNRGSAGLDGMEVEGLGLYLKITGGESGRSCGKGSTNHSRYSG